MRTYRHSVYMACVFFVGFLFCPLLGCLLENDADIVVATYNTAHGKETSHEQVAEAAAKAAPDFMALQETHYSEAEMIAEETGLVANEGTASKAFLSPFELEHTSYRLKESRWVRTLDVYEHPCLIFANVHLEIGWIEDNEDRLAQAEQVVDILENLDSDKPVILMGDFNAKPTWPTLGVIRDAGYERMSMMSFTFGYDSEQARKIDYIFASEGFDHSSWIVDDDASDHLPVASLIAVQCSNPLND